MDSAVARPSWPRGGREGSRMFQKIRSNDEAVHDIVFFQPCTTTPILFETLSLGALREELVPYRSKASGKP